jgi:TRAP-type C4-dicarboxylate transport system substrate-binding protein
MSALWASEIEKRTEGRVKMKLHFSGALVAAKETVNAVRTGPPAAAPPARASSPPGAAGLLLRGAVLGSRRSKIALDTIHKLQEPTRKLLESRGLKLMFNFPSAGLVSNCSNGHIKAVSDWKGKKVRSAGRWQGVQLPPSAPRPSRSIQGEVYVALQQKTGRLHPVPRQSDAVVEGLRGCAPYSRTGATARTRRCTT